MSNSDPLSPESFPLRYLLFVILGEQKDQRALCMIPGRIRFDPRRRDKISRKCPNREARFQPASSCAQKWPCDNGVLGQSLGLEGGSRSRFLTGSDPFKQIVASGRAPGSYSPAATLPLLSLWLSGGGVRKLEGPRWPDESISHKTRCFWDFRKIPDGPLPVRAVLLFSSPKQHGSHVRPRPRLRLLMRVRAFQAWGGWIFVNPLPV